MPSVSTIDKSRVNDVLAQYAALKSLNPDITSIEAGPALGVPPSTLRRYLQLYGRPGAVLAEELVVTPAPKTGETIEELLARKKLGMKRTQAHEAWANLIPVAVKHDGPIGLFLVGDPHVDDDGCDIEQLEHDLYTVGNTPGMFAGHIGDLTNNWVGRLKALYAHQSTRFEDGVKLTEWMLGLAPNLFVVGGNHDCWEQGMDLLRFVIGQSSTLQAHGARMALRWGDGSEIRIHARHDFSGRSQYSDTHGMKRELLFGRKDHILVAGHTHVDEARVEPSVEGDVHWMFRISGYKVVDEFANKMGFRPKRLAPGVTLILDPKARVPADVVKPFWDVEAAGDYLTYLRKRK